MLPGCHQQALTALHRLPVIFMSISTNETDLIVLPIDIESWPPNRWEQRFPKSRCKNFMSVLVLARADSVVICP